MNQMTKPLQAQEEAAKYATRREPVKGRRAWQSARDEAVWLLRKGNPAGALEAVMRGHRAEVFHTLGIGELRIRETR